MEDMDMDKTDSLDIGDAADMEADMHGEEGPAPETGPDPSPGDQDQDQDNQSGGPGPGSEAFRDKLEAFRAELKMRNSGSLWEMSELIDILLVEAGFEPAKPADEPAEAGKRKRKRR